MTAIPLPLRRALARTSIRGRLTMSDVAVIDQHVPHYEARLARALCVDVDEVRPMIRAGRVQTAPALAALQIEVEP